MNFVKILFVFMFTVFFIGCSPSLFVGPVITGITYWINGEAHRYYEEDTIILYRATKHALQELELPISEDKEKNNRYYLIAGKKNKFNIKIEKTESNMSRIHIRINTFGDKDYAELIYKKIQSQLSIIYFDKNGKPTLN